MLQKNIEKMERKERRNPTIPYSRSTKTLREKEICEARKNKQKIRKWLEED